MDEAAVIAYLHASAQAVGLPLNDARARAVAPHFLRTLALARVRIEASEPRINAFTARTAARARAEADAIDARRGRGERLPPLAGLPYAVKNLFDIEGLPTLAGSKIERTHPPATADAVLVQRLRAAGAVLLGALNMDEYAYGFTTENSHHGATRNPLDPARTAGGSSGGCGAAVAAAQVPLALGSDTNGSIRVPASFCGTWGLKPTFGRLSRRGSYPFVHSIDHLGPLADSVETLALAYDAMQGPDPQDPGCHALRVQPASPSLGQGVEGLRIGVLGGYFHELATPPARAAVAQAAQALGATGEVQWPGAALARAPPSSSPPARAAACTATTCAPERRTSSRCRWTASSPACCSRPTGPCARSASAASTATRSTRSSRNGTCCCAPRRRSPRRRWAPSGWTSTASGIPADPRSGC